MRLPGTVAQHVEPVCTSRSPCCPLTQMNRRPGFVGVPDRSAGPVCRAAPGLHRTRAGARPVHPRCPGRHLRDRLRRLLAPDRAARLHAETSMGLLMHHVHTPALPQSARSELPIPAALDRLVLSCLAKDLADRPQSAKELSLRLAEVSRSESHLHCSYRGRKRLDAVGGSGTRTRLRAPLTLHEQGGGTEGGQESCSPGLTPRGSLLSASEKSDVP
jgi:hypothetical protein